MKIADFLAKHEITMTSKRVEPTATRKAEYPNGFHWKCTFRCGALKLSVPFSQGSAHTGQPVARDVMDCLLSDYVDSDAKFEDWADDFGLDTDSLKALKTFRLCLKQSRNLDEFLGENVRAELQKCERE